MQNLRKRSKTRFSERMIDMKEYYYALFKGTKRVPQHPRPVDVGSQECPIWERNKKYGTKMEQSTYEYLASYSRSKKMTDKEARDYISGEFGFSPEKILIFQSAEAYITAKDRMPKIAESYERVPIWCYPDWNYIHFSVCGKMYEVINGILHKYENRRIINE